MKNLTDSEIHYKLDEELIKEIKQAMRPFLFCFRRHIKRDLVDKVRDRIVQDDVKNLFDIAQLEKVDLE